LKRNEEGVPGQSSRDWGRGPYSYKKSEKKNELNKKEERKGKIVGEKCGTVALSVS